MNIYEKCPELENEKFVIRCIQQEDCDDLWKVYSDKNALPFFNSDNCDGDNFYYATKEKMAEAIGFWNMAYKEGWFVRFSIVDKGVSCVIGTVELCLRVSENMLYDIFSLVTPKIEEMLGCKGVLTKAPIYAVERIEAIQKVGFTRSEHLLTGKTGYGYDGYWTIK